jgi:hypothetical protein
MHRLLPITICLIQLGLHSPSAKAVPTPKKKVRICIGDEYWYPYSEVYKGQVTGIHPDLAAMAIKETGFDVEFKPMSWAKCVDDDGRTGKMDIPLSAEWRQDREAWYHYPDDAAANGPKCKSKFSLTCVGSTLVVSANSNFKYTGDLGKVPQPVRIVTDLTEIKDFNDAGAKVETGPNDEANLAKLAETGQGSVVILTHSAAEFLRNPKFKNKFRVIEGYNYASDSFLPVSKKGQLTREDAQKIWTELAKLKKYPVLLDNAFKKYPPKKTEAPSKSR